MANFCSNCGASLTDGAKFCQKCGTPVVKAAAQVPKCIKCGAELKAGSKFCTVCGTPVGTADGERPITVNEDRIPPYSPSASQVQTEKPSAETTPERRVEQSPPAQPSRKAEENRPPVTEQPIRTAAKETAKTAVSQAGSAAKQTAAAAASQVKSAAAGAMQAPLANLTEQIASSKPGETVLGTFGNISGAAKNITEILNPFKTLLLGVKSFGQNFVGLFKNKQWVKLIIAGVIAVVWIVLMILRHLGINVGILNWLTFAQGGAGRSVPGWLGGLLGKTTVAAMIFSLFSGGFKSLGSGFKSLLNAKNFKPNNLGALLLGAGGALIVYQFFAGSATLTDTMSAISGALLSVTALGRGNGFLYRMAQSLTAKKAGTSRIANNEKIGGLLSGVTYGFTLGAAVSAIPFGWLPVILGGVCLIAGIVLMIVFGNKKEVAAA